MRQLHAKASNPRLAQRLSFRANDNQLSSIPLDFPLLICKGFAAAVIITFIGACFLYAAYILVKLLLQ